MGTFPTPRELRCGSLNAREGGRRIVNDKWGTARLLDGALIAGFLLAQSRGEGKEDRSSEGTRGKDSKPIAECRFRAQTGKRWLAGDVNRHCTKRLNKAGGVHRERVG